MLCPMRQTTLLLLVLPLVHPLAPPGHRLLARPRWEHARVARHAVERDQDGALDLVEYCEVTTQPDVCAFDAQETAAFGSPVDSGVASSPTIPQIGRSSRYIWYQ